MLKEEVQNRLSALGFSEVLNKTMTGLRRTHMIHARLGLKRFVEYYIDARDVIDYIWAFNDDRVNLIENLADFEAWINNNCIT